MNLYVHQKAEEPAKEGEKEEDIKSKIGMSTLNQLDKIFKNFKPCLKP
jgi:hypothetical protein